MPYDEFLLSILSDEAPTDKKPEKRSPEEIEAEEEARRNGEGFGALVGAGVLMYDCLTSQSEPQDTAEDEDVGFTQSM